MRVEHWRIFHFPFSIFNLNTAVVTNCHADAYIDCTWSGGEGVTFSNRHSLETVISWQTTNTVAWMTNHVDLVTTYEGGYAITNGYVIAVCLQAEPTTTFSLYITSAQLGRGTVNAVLVLDDEGGRYEASVPFQVIEPIRRLVTTERASDGRLYNPSRLVSGTNAVLKVSVNLAGGDTFDSTNAVFRPVSGPGEIVSQWRTGNDWYATVRATADSGEFVVEARFNGDKIQPRFSLPIVIPRVLNVRAFVVEPPAFLSNQRWNDGEIETDVFLGVDADWGRETGRGFYKKEDTLGSNIKSLLMYGFEKSGGVDIPFGSFWGYGDDEEFSEPTYIKVGSGFFQPQDNEVYSR